MQEIGEAIQRLEENISEIRTVTEWADELGYKDAKHFSKIIREEYKIGAKQVLVQTRFRALIKCIREHPHQKNYCTARDIGLADEVALNKYVKKHSGLTPTELKVKVLTGSIQPEEMVRSLAS